MSVGIVVAGGCCGGGCERIPDVVDGGCRGVGVGVVVEECLL